MNIKQKRKLKKQIMARNAEIIKYNETHPPTKEENR